MSARDNFHNCVRAALEKDGWTITHDPLRIKVDEIEFYMDLGAERIIAAVKAGQKSTGNPRTIRFYYSIRNS